MNYLFASTNFGSENLLKKELLNLGIKKINIEHGGVYYEANELLLYQSLMWSRIASKIFLHIKTFQISNIKDLYNATKEINWNSFFDVKHTFSINFKGTNKIVRNSFFGALVVKDAIVDQFNEKYYSRPNVDLINPKIRIKVFLLDKNFIHIMLDLSGNSLYKKNYRKCYNFTTIKESLGAALVLNSEWKKNEPIIDPMCGLGTLLIEAAMIFYDKAPGLERLTWGFQFWKKYNENMWKKVVKIAQKRFYTKLKQCHENYFIGYDYDSGIIEKAKINALQAGFAKKIKFFKKNLNHLKNILHIEKKKGLLLTNPPYEDREKTESELVALYIQLGIVAKKYFKNWKLSVFSSSNFLLSFIQMISHQEYRLKNGPLNCIQKNYHIPSGGENVENFEYQNRLKKNFKKLKKWTKKEKIECFRVYNSDLPNYKIIVDVYKNWVVIQEYKAPKKIDYNKTHQRLCHAIYYTKEILCIDVNKIILKIRKKNTEKKQYQRLFNKNNFIVVEEYKIKFLVNLTDYLDTGLFSEKRLIRNFLKKICIGKDFLNLFSYTGTATVCAGLGRAKTTTSIDISNTYINWSIKNMSINDLKGHKHVFIRDNCLDWIKKTNKKFDIIFINPPTFSNSKKMKKSFELKRDYLSIMKDLKKILRQNGKIIFSSSTHNFKIDLYSLKKIELCAKNITKKMQCKDYLNNSNIYHSWIIKHI